MTDQMEIKSEEAVEISVELCSSDWSMDLDLLSADKPLPASFSNWVVWDDDESGGAMVKFEQTTESLFTHNRTGAILFFRIVQTVA